MSHPIRVFVGADCNNCDLESQAVLEYTLRKFASQPVELTWMQQGHGPWAGWNGASARTPFTHFRWSVPALCGYEGRAIYCDSDFIFRADVAELWAQDIPGVLLLRNPEGKLKTCLMLIDCAKAKPHVPDLPTLKRLADANATATGYFREHRELLTPFSGDWNCVDVKGYEDINDPDIKAIHYSRIETQLHLKYALPRLAAEGRSHWYTGEVRTHWRADLIALFDAELEAAAAAGYTLDRYRVEPFDGFKRKNFTYSHHKGEAR